MKETNPKPFVFVLIPFSEEFNDIYEVGIKPACKDAGAYCEKVNEQIFMESILERVYNQIAKADIIVAEMTGRNPNVFYETGYAHALNKQVILLTKNTDDIPFDLKHYPHIVYEGKIAFLKSQLETRVRWCIDNPKLSLSSVDIDLQFSINNVHLMNNNEVRIKKKIFAASTAFEMKIAIHNISNRISSPNAYSLALITPGNLELELDYNNDFYSVIQLHDKRNLFNLHQKHSIFPDGWSSLSVWFSTWTTDGNFIAEKLPIDMTLRLFTELGPRDHPFILKLED